MLASSSSELVPVGTSHIPAVFPVQRLVIYTEPELNCTGSALRKAITAINPDGVLHNHLPDGRPRYALPSVRYLVMGGCGHLITCGEGIDYSERFHRCLKSFRIANTCYAVIGTEIERVQAPFGAVETMVSYRSLTSWVALNQKNHRKYMRCGSSAERRELLGSILVGNLLALSKSRDHWVERHIRCRVREYRQLTRSHKQVNMLAFRVAFDVNFLIPPWIGIGKLVSKGHGIMVASTSSAGRSALGV